MKLARRTLSFHAWFLVLILGLMAAACGGPWRDGYFKKGVDRLTQEEIFEKMGLPTRPRLLRSVVTPFGPTACRTATRI